MPSKSSLNNRIKSGNLSAVEELIGFYGKRKNHEKELAYLRFWWRQHISSPEDWDWADLVKQEVSLWRDTDYKTFLTSLEIPRICSVYVPEKATIERLVDEGHYRQVDADITSDLIRITSRGPRKLYIRHFRGGELKFEIEERYMKAAKMQLAEPADLLCMNSRFGYPYWPLSFPTTIFPKDRPWKERKLIFLHGMEIDGCWDRVRLSHRFASTYQAFDLLLTPQ